MSYTGEGETQTIMVITAHHYPKSGPGRGGRGTVTIKTKYKTTDANGFAQETQGGKNYDRTAQFNSNEC